MKIDKEKFIFLARNLARGLLWLSLLVGGFFLFKKYVDINYLEWLKPVYEKPLLVYAIYSLSEVLFGIIPPEIFMMWGLRSGKMTDYATIVILLAIISYLAGCIGFLIGRYLENTQFFKIFKNKVFGKYEKYLFHFGSFIIIVAALTPLPFSGVSMLVGSVEFPPRKYLLFALSRFLRFFVYAYVIWEVNAL
ncbi:YqaA family protein [Catalinimonas niigatensis]|uniref:YqaA family protein n=1 Tax=Catalinimonas niigatensis TaxID=1397264 RepID=UPI00266503D7|nr:VTT domain-containing protein [Catalinimonas niigatensis]WPP50254.1 VTT domain-containing protein [Catalinimonas niigatensis]